MICFIGSAIDASYNKYAADLAWTRQKEVLKNSVQWKARDIEAAGMNKYLAVTGGGMGSGGVSVQKASPSNMAGGIKELGDARKQSPEVTTAKNVAARSKSDAENAYHNVFKTMAEGSVAEEKALQERENTKVIQASTPFKVSTEDLKDSTYGRVKRFFDSTAAPWLKKGERWLQNAAPKPQ